MNGADRFWVKVQVGGPDECWLWIAGKYRGGYGQFDNTAAHRRAYELSHGAIADGLVIDHLCMRRDCVNPSHLQAVTQGENVRRGYGPSVAAARSHATSLNKTHCNRGHELTPENLYTRPSNPSWKSCRACRIQRRRERRALARAN